MTFSTQALQKSRKEHHCAGCQRIFPAGSELYKIAGKDRGSFYSYRLCQLCDALIKEQDDDYWRDGWLDGDVRWQGWDVTNDGGEFLKGFLQKNKPVCVEWEGSWRLKKDSGKYERLEPKIYYLDC